MTRRPTFGIAAVILLAAGQVSGQPLPDSAREAISRQILAVQDEVFRGFNSHDVTRIVSHIEKSSDLRYVEHTQVTVGWETLRKGLETWHRENRDLTARPSASHVNVLSEQVAVLTTAGTILKSGVEAQRFTWTAVFRLMDDGWKIVSAHEAFSDIVAPATGGAAAGTGEVRTGVDR